MVVVAQHLMIHGRVQGVWYRKWTVDTARGLGLAGWVRNRMDGCVEAVVEGEAGAVKSFIEQAYDGPPAAAVERIACTTTAPEGFATFDKRNTA